VSAAREGGMSEAEIFALVQQVHEQYAALFAQVITINFAMIVAIFYFLHRARTGFRIAAFLFYLIGMLTLTGMMLHAANIKGIALAAMASIPAPSPVVRGYLALQGGWLFRAISFFQNMSLWAMGGVIAYMLFWWRNPHAGTHDVS
jgi:hypothetical protein